MENLFRRYFELSFWIIALLSLAFMKPGVDPHYSFCILKMAGFHFCPGCGLGHSINFLFHGDLQSSFSSHPLGVFAVAMIVYRIYKLFVLHFSHSQKQFYGQQF